jgi:hypothetical protein
MKMSLPPMAKQAEIELEREHRRYRLLRIWSAKGVRLAQKVQVGPRTPVGIQLEKAEVFLT